MLAALDGFLNDTRARRLDKELRTALGARFKLLEEAIRAHYVTLPRTAKMDCRPRYIDFAFTPECRAIADVPTSETVTLAQFTAVVPALAEKWDADRRAELLAYLRPHLGKVAPAVDPLSLAIAVFKPKTSCYVDGGRMRYPTIFTHDCRWLHCFRGAKLKNAEALRQEDAYTRAVHCLKMDAHELGELEKNPDLPVYIDAPFHLRELAGDSGAAIAVEGMRRIVSALGLDPARATFDDVERADVWLCCVTCETERPNDSIWAMPWTRAVSFFVACVVRSVCAAAYTPSFSLQYAHDGAHLTGFGGRCVMAKWRRVDDEDMGKVRTLRRIEPLPETDFYRRALWACSLCPAFDAKCAAMTEHLKQT